MILGFSSGRELSECFVEVSFIGFFLAGLDSEDFDLEYKVKIFEIDYKKFDEFFN